jgi:branched-chain amino acid transport system substrate-binding protein
VGVILSLTGPAASLGVPARNTVNLWPKKIGGQDVVLTVLDDGSDPGAATSAARKLTSEEHVDVIVGPSVTATALAIMQVAQETGTPVMTLAGGGAIVSPMNEPRRWMFKMPPAEEIPLRMILKDMQAKGKSRLAVVAVSNAYGETFLKVLRELAPKAHVSIVGVERFNPNDLTFTSQAIKLVASQPDAVFIAAVGTPGATPHIELVRRGFTGTIYQTQAIANNDFLRVGGSDVEGALFPASPLLVAEQLPDGNAIKPVALDYLKVYEGQYGKGSRSLFGAMAWDARLFLERAIVKASATATPGTDAFRSALRDALETASELVVTQGVYSLSPQDHNGADERSQVMVAITKGGWSLVPTN